MITFESNGIIYDVSFFEPLPLFFGTATYEWGNADFYNNNINNNNNNNNNNNIII